MEAQAVALGEASFGPPPSGVTDEQLLDPTRLPGADYPIAGDLGAYLLTRFGPAQLEQAIDRVPWGSAPTDVESGFSAVFGETMTELRADRAASPLQFPADRIQFSECQAIAPDPELGAGQQVSETLDCTTNGVGTIGAAMFRYVPFDVDQDGIYALNFGGAIATSAQIAFGGCGSATTLTWAPASNVPVGAFVVGYMPKGRYFLTLTAVSESPATYPFTVQSLSAGNALACTAISPIPIPSGTSYLVVFSMTGGALDLPVSLDSTSSLVTFGRELNDVQACLAGCDQGCTSTQSVPAPEATVGTTVGLSISAAAFAESQGSVIFDIE